MTFDETMLVYSLVTRAVIDRIMNAYRTGFQKWVDQLRGVDGWTRDQVDVDIFAFVLGDNIQLAGNLGYWGYVPVLDACPDACSWDKQYAVEYTVINRETGVNKDGETYPADLADAFAACPVQHQRGLDRFHLKSTFTTLAGASGYTQLHYIEIDKNQFKFCCNSLENVMTHEMGHAM